VTATAIAASAARVLSRRGMLAIVLAVVAVAIMVGGLLRTSASAPRKPGGLIPVAARHPAPSLAGGHPVQGHPGALARYRGRVVFLNFWASWCHPCRKEAPQLVRFAASLSPRHATVVGVDVNDTPGAARAFLRRFDVRYPILADPSATIAVRYHLAGIPTTFVLDRRGRIAARLLGPQTLPSLRRMFAEVAGG
jgi:thiol-disulfide isomerase/thioredoxin